MKLSGERYEILSSKDANVDYWQQDVFPDWAAINLFKTYPIEPAGSGVEPHYHDADEIWLFSEGRGELWLDDNRYDITPNTVVYTPMGVVHRFQMFTPFKNTAIVTPLEWKKRTEHLLVEREGPPQPTATGFVVSGTENNGAFPDPGTRCPLSELRRVDFAVADELTESELRQNEHWNVTMGELRLAVDGVTVTLTEEDVALLRAGAVRAIHATAQAQAVVARERPLTEN